jgi:hypothetical protein
MAVRKSTLRLERPVKDVAPDEEHRRFLVLAREEVVKYIVRAVGSVVESVAYRLGLRYASYVLGQSRDLRGRTFSCRPPCLNDREKMVSDESHCANS